MNVILVGIFRKVLKPKLTNNNSFFPLAMEDPSKAVETRKVRIFGSRWELITRQTLDCDGCHLQLSSDATHGRQHILDKLWQV